ncbi:Ctr-domain-containing protein [Biscogniauxia sp. FL1348]|nr:Ctr-domain-containing protein [Biscogniauxia sp. FL1348]
MAMTQMTMDMSSTATATAASAATSTSMPMGMDMGGSDAGPSCKISMLWNWNTIDACFLSSSWHVTSPGMFAGSCIGVILLTMSLELLRRAVREYDRYLVRKHAPAVPAASGCAGLIGSQAPTKANSTSTSTTIHQTVKRFTKAKPSMLEQSIRALLHTIQVAVSYFVMLLAMYFNGYIIISIFIGAYLGAFVFHWETLEERDATNASKEPVVCCA